MIKREAKFTVLFRHWLLAQSDHFHFSSCAFELKQTPGDMLPFSDVKDHQIDALIAVKRGEKGLLWKLPDDSRNIKPFDLFYLHAENAWIVIKYGNHFFCLIDIDAFCHERKHSKRKSLTAERAKELAFMVIDLKH